MALMLSKWYPPARYVFMPMYRFYRRLFRVRRPAFVALMATSGLLHLLVVGGGMFLAPHPNRKLLMWFFAIVYGALTLASCFAPLKKN